VALAISNPQATPLVLALALGSSGGNSTNVVELTYQNGQFEITKNILIRKYLLDGNGTIIVGLTYQSG
jgi:hypothetical protein